jgi:glycosyltransferase involved in cell wall biosynthesis
VALVSDGVEFTSEEQLSPFRAYRVELRAKLQLISLRLQLSDVLRAPRLLLAPFDIIILKMSFRTPTAEALRKVQCIREAAGGRKVLYFDGDDDLCIQWPELLAFVDLYVKKHVFRDRARYLDCFYGKSNLTDYVQRHFACTFENDKIASASGPVRSEHIEKIAVGWNLALDRRIAALYRNVGAIGIGARRNDIVCRAGLPKDWLHYLRRDVEPALRRMEPRFRIIAPVHRVPPDVYLQELQGSKICVSPFGYGEICWRDFEAIACGCLLVKPDMSHVETYPDIFRPHQTYVPIRWDLADLEDICEYYLKHDAERMRIVASARSVLADFYTKGGFITRVTEIFRRAQ